MPKWRWRAAEGGIFLVAALGSPAIPQLLTLGLFALAVLGMLVPMLPYKKDG